MAAETLQGIVADIVARMAPPGATIGVRIEDAAGRVLADVDGARGLIPASNQKLLTTAAALEVLGAAATVSTRLMAAAPPGPDGRVRGDLWLVGGGDPRLAPWLHEEERFRLADLDALARLAHDAGIRGVEGRLRGDGSAFDGDFFHEDWPWAGLADSDYAGVSALGVCENAYRYRVRPAAAVGAPAAVELEPHPRGLIVESTVTTVADAAAATERFLLPRPADANVLRLGGAIAVGAPVYTNRAAVHDGVAVAAGLVGGAMARHGIALGGGIGTGRAPAGAVELAARPSPPVAELAWWCNRPSNNYVAECLARLVGGGRDGAAALTAWMARRAGVATPALEVRDGSGLSRVNRIQPAALCALLRTMWHDEQLRTPFLESLPTNTGPFPLTRFFRAADTVRLHAKTGSLENVRALSGYLFPGLSGEPRVFSVICNGIPGPSRGVDPLIDAVLLAARGE